MAGNAPSVVQNTLVALLVLLVLTPIFAIVRKGTNLRRGLWRVGCWRWVICCDRLFGESVDRVDMFERGGAQTLAAHYQLMLGAREPPTPSLALRLAASREHTRRDARRSVITAKLEQIQIQDHRMEREEPLVLPAQADVDAEAKMQLQREDTTSSAAATAVGKRQQGAPAAAPRGLRSDEDEEKAARE